MKEQIQELYQLGLEKFAGDEQAAKDFVVGFMKEASLFQPGASTFFGKHLLEGAGKAAGGALAGLGLGLTMHGVSSMINSAANVDLRKKFEAAFDHAMNTNPLLEDVDQAKARSYAETMFKFAPHVVGDPNLMSSLLAHTVQGSGVDPTTIRALTDLEAKLIESRKSALFTPKSYM